MATPNEFDADRTWHFPTPAETPKVPAPAKPATPPPGINGDATMTIQAAIKEASDPLGVEEAPEEELPDCAKLETLEAFFAYAKTLPDSALSTTERMLINNAQTGAKLGIELKFDRLPRRYRLTIARLMIKAGKGNKIQNVPDEIRAQFAN